MRLVDVGVLQQVLAERPREVAHVVEGVEAGVEAAAAAVGAAGAELRGMAGLNLRWMKRSLNGY